MLPIRRPRNSPGISITMAISTKYASGATFVLDAGASQYGFHLGAEEGKNYNTFRGYMIGTGKVKGDIIYFDLSEVSTTGYAKKLTRSASAVTSFGSGANHEANGWYGEAIEQEKIGL